MVVADLLGVLAEDGFREYNVLTSSVFENDKLITVDKILETMVNPNATYRIYSDQVTSSSLQELLSLNSGSPPSLHSSDATTTGAPDSTALRTAPLPLLNSQQTPSPPDPATTDHANLLDTVPSQPLPPAATDHANLHSTPSQPLQATDQSTTSSLFICQVPGCGVAHKKPWNHLYQGKRHKTLSAEDKKRFLELVRLAGPTNTPSVKLEINQEKAAGEESQTAQYTITTTGRQKFGDTRNLPSIPLDNPELLEFGVYLKSVAGGGKRPHMAKQFCIDLGKYLKFASDPPTIKDVLSFARISEYLEKLRALGLGPSGQAAKLTVIKTAMKFLQFK